MVRGQVPYDLRDLFERVNFWRGLACKRIMRKRFWSVEVASLGVLHGDCIC